MLAIDTTHADVRYAPEDEAKEGVEERGHQGEQITKERDDFGLGHEGSV